MIKINKKSYSSVTEMVRDTIDDKDFVAAFEKHLGETQIGKKLFVLRNSRGLSEQEVAKKMGCRPSRVSKLEHGKDANLRLGDLFAYLAALNTDATIALRHQGQMVVITRLCDDHATVDDGNIREQGRNDGNGEPSRETNLDRRTKVERKNRGDSLGRKMNKAKT